MKIAVIDSGFGGLNVLAKAYELIKQSNIGGDVELIFVEALPKGHKDCPWNGYNAMPDADTRIKVFNGVLEGIEAVIKPDLYVIACNTLSAIISLTDFSKSNNNILNIIDYGIESLIANYSLAKSNILLLGTQMTIDSKIHIESLSKQSNFDTNKFIEVPVATKLRYPLAIETEPDSDRVYSISKMLIENAVKGIDFEEHIIVYLGCTHFSFIKNIYADVLNNLGYHNNSFFDPNDFAAKRITSIVDSQKILKISSNIYSQFKLSDQQLTAGESLIRLISCDIADSFINYKLKVFF